MPQDELRIGIFVCECGSNIAGSVDCDALVEFAKTLPDVVFTCKNKYTCSDPGQDEIKKNIVEHKLNRVVIASCTPRMHESTFRNCVESVGLNPYLMEMANIREHCSWIHLHDKKIATEKAKDIIKASYARARFLEAQTEPEFPVIEKALVIGGGVAGIHAALDMANAGYQVYMVEKSPSIGGITAQLDKIYPSMD
jgi:heterodisulfide reductase subunit A